MEINVEVNDLDFWKIRSFFDKGGMQGTKAALRARAPKTSRNTENNPFTRARVVSKPAGTARPSDNEASKSRAKSTTRLGNEGRQASSSGGRGGGGPVTRSSSICRSNPHLSEARQNSGLSKSSLLRSSAVDVRTRSSTMVNESRPPRAPANKPKPAGGQGGLDRRSRHVSSEARPRVGLRDAKTASRTTLVARSDEVTEPPDDPYDDEVVYRDEVEFEDSKISARVEDTNDHQRTSRSASKSTGSYENLSNSTEMIKFREKVRRKSSMSSQSSRGSLTTSSGRSESKTSAVSVDTIEPEVEEPLNVSRLSFFEKKKEVEMTDADMSSAESGIDVLDSKEAAVEKKPVTRRARVFSVDENVGFGYLPDQVYRKAVRKGFEFSLMVVGESGLGKSTLVNSMFLTNIYTSQSPDIKEGLGQTLQVETHHVTLEEKGVKLNLTVVDTPGFGDAVDNSNCWKPIVNYIDEQFEKYLEGESRVKRDSTVQDTRVHACLYFIAPTGHGLKPLDVEFMRKIHHKVNIIPVIGKADCCTKEEIISFKKKVVTQLQEMKIDTYDFPESELCEENFWMRERLPFAVVGSNTLIETGGGKIRGRQYSWGNVNIEDKNHCDFSPLRCLLLSHHMQDLREVTHNLHYENYRSDKLSGSDLPPYTTFHPSQSLPGLSDSLQDDESDFLDEDFKTKDGKKKWIVKWSRGRLDLEERYLPNKMLPFRVQMPGKGNSISMAELRTKSNESLAGFRSMMNSLKKVKHSVAEDK